MARVIAPQRTASVAAMEASVESMKLPASTRRRARRAAGAQEGRRAPGAGRRRQHGARAARGPGRPRSAGPPTWRESLHRGRLQPVDPHRLLEARRVLEVDGDEVAALQHLGRGLGEARFVAIERRQGQGAGQSRRQGPRGRPAAARASLRPSGRAGGRRRGRSVIDGTDARLSSARNRAASSMRQAIWRTPPLARYERRCSRWRSTTRYLPDISVVVPVFNEEGAVRGAGAGDRRRLRRVALRDRVRRRRQRRRHRRAPGRAAGRDAEPAGAHPRPQRRPEPGDPHRRAGGAGGDRGDAGRRRPERSRRRAAAGARADGRAAGPGPDRRRAARCGAIRRASAGLRGWPTLCGAGCWTTEPPTPAAASRPSAARRSCACPISITCTATCRR